MAKRKLSVFLSYAAGDVAAARTLYGQLTAEGWMNVWFGDEDLLVGEGKNYEIKTAIHDADLAIICISKKAAKESGPFQKQLRLILEKAEEMPEGTIFIIPLRLEECDPPFVLRDLQFADYYEGNRDEIYPKVLRSLKSRAKMMGINTNVEPVPVSSAKISNHVPTSVPIESNEQPPNVTIGGKAQKNIVAQGNDIHITQNNIENTTHIHGKPENAETKSRINTGKVTFTPKEDFTAGKQDGTNQYAYIEIFNGEEYDLQECYVTLNAVYVSDGDTWLSMLQHINPNISHLIWPSFQLEKNKFIRRNKSARINISKTLAGNIAFTLEDGDHTGLGSLFRNDYYIEIELNGILNSHPIEALIFTGFLHDKSKLDIIPDRPPRVSRRLYIEEGELDETLRGH